MAHPLSGARLKVIRAEKHLNDVLKIVRRHENGSYTLIPEKHQDSDVGFLRVHLTPKLDEKLSVIIGDFLFNLRSTLDHIVWQLVLVNHGTPRNRNLFPICESAETFDEAIRKHRRLDGVSTQAIAVIESLQPYPTRQNEPLALLSKLHNIDKHQNLNASATVAEDAFTGDTEMAWSTEAYAIATGLPSLTSILLGQELRDDAVIPIPGLNLSDPILCERFLKMKVHGKGPQFIAFEDCMLDPQMFAIEERHFPHEPSFDHLRVDTILQEILEFFRDSVLPSFEPFFN